MVYEVEGVVLNGIEPFRTIEPTPERLVAWLRVQAPEIGSGSPLAPAAAEEGPA